MATTLYMALSIDRLSAQAIAAYHPELGGGPFVVVRQNAESHKSHVWSCSLAALGRGVNPGMPVPMAVKRCPGLKVLPRDEALEQVVCREMGDVLYEYTPEYEVKPSGACLANLTGTPVLGRLEPSAVAEEVRETAGYRIGLEEIAAGVASTRLLARLMAKLATPSDVRACAPGAEEETLASLATSLLPGLSSACRQKLKAYGLKRVEQVQQIGKKELIARLGREGERLYAMVRGMESGEKQGPGTRGPSVRPAGSGRLRTSWGLGERQCPMSNVQYGISNEGRKQYGMRNTEYGISNGRRTTHEIAMERGEKAYGDVVAETMLERDINDQEVLIQKVRLTADKLAFELQSKKLWTKRMTFVLTYTDNRSAQRTVSWPTATNAFGKIAETAVRLFGELYQRRVAIKSFRLTGRSPRLDPGQLSLLETGWEVKQRKAAGAITEVRKRMGFGSVLSAASMKEGGEWRSARQAEDGQRAKIEFGYGR